MRSIFTPGLAAFVTAALLWIPSVQWFFPVAPLDTQADSIRESLWHTQLNHWQAPFDSNDSIDRMRLANGEWDFMARTFFVLALANRALEMPAQSTGLLRLIDRIIEDTEALEAAHGQDHFLLSYVHANPFVDPSARSLFVDGELALMMAARQRVEPVARWRIPLQNRISQIADQMARGPIASAESYPNECWMFCNTVALAALTISDQITQEDHRPLIDRWLNMAKTHLVDAESGLLVSSYTLDGITLDGPEGSSIFMTAHMLQIVDPVFAQDQYTRARLHLGEMLFGFGWAREWPSGIPRQPDVDSGPVIPGIEASAGSSGMALLGAAAFHDHSYLHALHRSLQLAAFPTRESGNLRFAASNVVGDAVLLYSLSQGPLWSQILHPNASPQLARVVR